MIKNVCKKVVYTKCSSLLIFHRIKKRQKRRSPLNRKIRSPPFLRFFDPSKIERPMAFSLRLAVHALCLDQLCSTCNLFSSLCTHLYRRTWRHPGLSRGLESELILTNRKQQYNLHEPHRPITNLEICPLQTYKHTNIQIYTRAF